MSFDIAGFYKMPEFNSSPECFNEETVKCRAGSTEDHDALSERFK